jgi:filamentous hemagglutinin family protein
MKALRCPTDTSKLTLGSALRVCLCSALSTQLAFAGPLPTDPTIIHGQLVIQSAGKSMNIQQASQYGIINWNSFNVGSGHAVHFNNGSGATLNRVTGLDASSLNGTLSATGSLYLLNRNGIIIGADGRVLTGGSFVASTLDMANADFLNGGDFNLFGNSPQGVTNLGKISSTSGSVLLAGYTVSNKGDISAPNGHAGLVAGTRIDVLTDSGWLNGAYAVSLGERGNDVTNEGRIQALVAELRTHNGNIYALAGNNSGLIQATGVRTEDGRVFLTAGDGTVQSSGTITASRGTNGGDITIEAASVENFGGTQDVSGNSGGTLRITTGAITSDTTMLARGTAGSGGTITVEADREVLITSAGVIDAGGMDRGGEIALDAGAGAFVLSGNVSANASAGQGGRISLWAERVSLLGATVDASGSKAGGDIYVGGGYHGGDIWQGLPVLLAVANAQRTYISDKTTLRADATGPSGKGGTVVTWADGTTEFAGKIFARGGTGSGAGGIVETSGLAGLGASGTVDASARGTGANGQWLLDPKNITIGTVTDSIGEFQSITSTLGGTTADTLVNDNYFGQFIDLSGETLVVGSSRANAAYIFESGRIAARLTSNSNNGSANFGQGVQVADNIVASTRPRRSSSHPAHHSTSHDRAAVSPKTPASNSRQTTAPICFTQPIPAHRPVLLPRPTPARFFTPR